MGNASSLFSSETRRTLLLSLIIVGVVIGLYFILRSKKHEPPAQTTNQVEIAAVTPLSYTMISGKVSAVDQESKTVNVAFIRIDQSGHTSTRTYTVTVGAATTLESVNQAVSPATVTPLALSDLAVGDEVAALGDQELANLSTFTATKIIRTK